jgi:hypothetical protein
MKRACALSVTIVLLLAAAPEVKKPKEAFTDPKEAGPDFLIQGEYEGSVVLNRGEVKVGAQVIDEGDGKFKVRILSGGLPGDGWDGKGVMFEANAQTKDGVTEITGKDLSGDIFEGKMHIKGGLKIDTTLKRVERKSKTLGEKPPEGAVVLFDGSKADEWEGGKIVGDHLLNNGIVSKKKFGDFKLHVEFILPFMPKSRGQGRSNSGVFLQDRYEVQVLDSFGLKGTDDECAGIYKQSAPSVNMCYPPLQWQTYDEEFKAARFDKDGNKTKDAVVTVYHNGVKVQDNFKLKHCTPGRNDKEDAKPGPIHLQNHGDPVHYRNIWVVEQK